MRKRSMGRREEAPIVGLEEKMPTNSLILLVWLTVMVVQVDLSFPFEGC